VPGLNEGQTRALHAALAMGPGELLLIQGPPGTGKTSLIAQLTRQLVLRDFWRDADGPRPVLILANTHRACNEVVLRLHERFPDLRPYLVRLGPVAAGMEPAVREHVITERLGVGARLEDLDILHDGPAALAGLVRQGHALLDEGLVFVGTLASATRPELRGREFSTIIVDETGQATEPAVLQALRHAARGYQSRLILVGDHCQLPPVVLDEVTVPPLTPAILGIGLDEKRGQRQSLFERLAGRSPETVLTLGDQYRMCAPISELVSETFYDGKLRPGSPAVAARHLGELLDQAGATLPSEPFARAAFEPGWPVVLVDTSHDASAGDTVSLQARAETRDNPREAALIADLVAGLLLSLAPAAREALSQEIGIISPYRKQNNRIRQELGERLGPAADQIRVDTVDRFQGGERDVILLSLVASNPAASIGALHADWRRMNVAISRARRKVILVGNRLTFVTPSTEEEEPAKKLYRHLFALLDAQVAQGVARVLEPAT
jgi:DNA replication ATP-dependent helicase Dna2